MMKTRTLICACLVFATVLVQAADPGAAMKERLSQIIIPKLEVEGASLAQVITDLQSRAKELSPDGYMPNIIFLGSDAAAQELTVTMSFADVPLSEMLRYLAAGVGLELRYEEHAAVLTQAASGSLSCEVKVMPTGEPHQYRVDYRLTEGKNVLSSPKLTVTAGNEGTVQIGSGDHNCTFRGTALVTEHANGTATAHTTLRLFDEKGKVRFFLTQDVTLAGTK